MDLDLAGLPWVMTTQAYNHGNYPNLEDIFFHRMCIVQSAIPGLNLELQKRAASAAAAIVASAESGYHTCLTDAGCSRYIML